MCDIKPTLADHYEKWLQKHPDGIEHEHTPNARTREIAHDDTASRAKALREKFQADERTMQELREKQIEWKREQLQAQDDEEKTRRKNAATAAARQVAVTNAPDYIFSRTPNGYRSQSTVVLSDGRSPGEVNCQEQMRLREEEITRRQAEAEQKKV